MEEVWSTCTSRNIRRKLTYRTRQCNEHKRVNRAERRRC